MKFCDEYALQMIDDGIDMSSCPCGCSNIEDHKDVDSETIHLMKCIVEATFHSKEAQRIQDQEKALKFVLDKFGREARNELYSLFVGRPQ